MRLTYNGVELHLMSLQMCERTNVYTPDNTDLLYVKWRIGATCVFSTGGNPFGTAAADLSEATKDEIYGRLSPALSSGTAAPPSGPVSYPGSTGGTPTLSNRGRAGASALIGAPPSLVPWRQNKTGRPDLVTGAMSDVEARNRLFVPRRPLKISTIDAQGQEITWLESPRYGQPCDANNGPRPIGVDVVSVAGEGAGLGLYFQIETCVPPCPYGSDNAVLAHRWEMTHSYNASYHLTRVTRGAVIFDTGLIQALGFDVDLLRPQFFHPIPLGFRRYVPAISLSMDGSTLTYEIADVDEEICFDPAKSGATHIDIQENMGYRTPWRFL